MNDKTQQSDQLTDSLAEGIAAVMAASAELDDTGDMADLFLEELSRLWAEPAPELPFDDAAWVV